MVVTSISRPQGDQVRGVVRGHQEGERGHADGTVPARTGDGGDGDDDAPEQQHDGRTAERQPSAGRRRGQLVSQSVSQAIANL